MSCITSPSTSTLDRMIGQIDDVLRAATNDPQHAVAEIVSTAVTDPLLLPPEFRRSSPDHYRTNVVHVADDGAFSVVALVWRPGQSTPIHSHRSWCVVAVHEGAEVETTYALDDRPGDGPVLRPLATSDFRVGDVASLGAVDDIHAVKNDSDGLAISLHVYGLDYRRFGSSILEVFDSHLLRTNRSSFSPMRPKQEGEPGCPSGPLTRFPSLRSRLPNLVTDSGERPGIPVRSFHAPASVPGGPRGTAAARTDLVAGR